jgi:signal transduction histidine kinase
MSRRMRSVRKRILLLTLVPVVSLIGLYIFTTSITASDALTLARANSLKNTTGEPTGNFLAQIETERPLAMVYLAAPNPANLARLNQQAAKTTAAAAFMRATLTSGSTQGSASPAEKKAVNTLLDAAGTLPTLRTQILAGATSIPAAYAAYNDLVSDAYQVLDNAVRQEPNATLVAQGLAFVRMGRAEDMLGMESSLLLTDLASRSFTPADRQQFAELVGARRAVTSLTLQDLDQPYHGYYTHDVNPQAYATLTAMENAAINDTHLGAPPVQPLAWIGAVDTVSGGLGRAGQQSATEITRQASQAALTTNMRLIIAGGLGLLAVVLSIVVAILTGRGLVRELSELRESALDLADHRLPEAVDRLAGGDDVDIPAELAAAEEAPAAKSDEIGQVREAFAKVQRTALEAAVGQARMRRGVSDVFRNLARRSQSLLHRQLALLDAMERRARDPQELEGLFRIDHLTTRMRRHAESLIILSGHPPARGWRNPVPMVDVLRASIAEVEDYTRIKVASGSRAALAGPAVGDVIHMIAELAENATLYSPPNTHVVITGDIVGQGFAVEIEDRGLGLSEAQQDQINDLMANPPPFDLSGTDQLGLFVASQLAKRHNIKISFRPSPYGGTTVIVVIPTSLVVPEGAMDSPAPVALESAAQLGGRHATSDGHGLDRDEAAPRPLAPAAFGGFHAETTQPTLSGAAADDPDDWPVNADGLINPVPQQAPPWATAEVPGAGDASAGDPSTAGLPRRIRQASLAPQLRDQQPPHPNSSHPFAPAPPLGASTDRSPEEIRATMAAIQAGWERGRSIFGTPDTSEPGRSPGQGEGRQETGLGFGPSAADGMPSETTIPGIIAGIGPSTGLGGDFTFTAADDETTGAAENEASRDGRGPSGWS